ncbi:hypothetical protein [Nostoc sp.]
MDILSVMLLLRSLVFVKQLQSFHLNTWVLSEKARLPLFLAKVWES